MAIPPIPPPAPLLRQKVQASSIRGVYNVIPANLQKLRGKMSQVISGTGTTQFKLFIGGDSTTTGAGAGTGSVLLTGASALKPANQLAAALTRRNIPNVCDMFYGDGGAQHATSTPSLYDPKITLGSPWTLNENPAWFGYGMFLSTGTGALTFLPTTSWDTAEIIYAQNSTLGTASITLGGVAPTTGPSTINGQSGTQAMQRATVTAASVGTRNVVVTATGGGSFYVAGIRVWNSTKAQIQITSASNYGRVVADLASAGFPWEFRSLFTFHAPDFTIWNVALNDLAQSTSVSSYTTNLQLLITAALSVGNCALVIPEFRNDATAAQHTAIFNAVYGLAIKNGIPLIDLSEAIGPYAGGNTAGMYGDQVHLSAAGYALVGEIYARLLTEL